MKKVKLLTAVLLIASLLLSICPQAFAANIEWLTQYPIVCETVYERFDRGVVIGNGGGTQSFVAYNGVTVIPYGQYEYISIVDDERGYLACRDRNGVTTVMDIYRNVIMPAGTVDWVYKVLGDNRVVAGKQTKVDRWGYRYYDYGVTDYYGNIIIPYGQYDDFEADRHGVIMVRDFDYEPGVIGAYGEVVISTERKYSSIHSTGSPYRFIAVGGNYNEVILLDNAGNELVTMVGKLKNQYDIPVENYFSVYKEGTNVTKIYDLNGNIVKELSGKYTVIKDKYLYDETDSENVALKDFNGNYLINPNGYSYFNFCEGSNYLIGTNYRSYNQDAVYDFNGNKIIQNGALGSIHNIHEDKYIYCSKGTADMYGNLLINTEGYSAYYLGNDTFIMEDYIPETMNVELRFFKVSGVSKREIGPAPEAPVTTIKVVVDGVAVNFEDQQPVIVDGRTLLPLRAVFNILGASVDWNAGTQTVTSERNGVTVTLTIGSNQLFVNGAVNVLDVVAQIMNGRTMVPVRAIADAFGCGISWDAATSTVTITTH